MLRCAALGVAAIFLVVSRKAFISPHSKKLIGNIPQKKLDQK
jgi:hypothetical protein